MSKRFGEMWDLVLRVHGFHNPVFPPSLLIAIFWEETMFTNRRQIGGPAVGFGQVQVADLGWKLKSVDVRYNSEAAILASDELSVGATSAILDYMYFIEGRTFDNCLDVYGGVKARPVNAVAIANWKQCMQNFPGPGSFTADNVKAALRLAKAVPDDAFHEDFWSFVLRGLMPATLLSGIKASIGS